MKLACCSGAEAERWLRTSDHVTVCCAACPTTFCIDRKDAEAELEHRPNKREPNQGLKRRWYCLLACLNTGRQIIGVNPSEATQEARRQNAAKAVAAKKTALPGTETRDQAQGTLLDEEAS